MTIPWDILPVFHDKRARRVLLFGPACFFARDAPFAFLPFSTSEIFPNSQSVERKAVVNLRQLGFSTVRRPILTVHDGRWILPEEANGS